MQPDKIEAKRLKLVGVEMYINLQDNSGYKHFSYKINAMKAEIMARLHEIQNKKNENICIGMWQSSSLDDPNNHRSYFLGVEVNDYKNIPYGMIYKDLPESKFAIFNESKRGTALYSKDGGYVWLKNNSNYNFNSKIIADFETDNFDEKITDHEVWIPIVEK